MLLKIFFASSSPASLLRGASGRPRRRRRNDQHRRVRRLKIIFRHALNVCRRSGEVAIQLRIREARIFSDYRRGRQRHRLLFIRIAAENVSGDFLILSFFQLFRFRRLRFQSVQHADQRFFAFFRRVPLVHDRVGPEKIWVLGERAKSRGLHRNLFLVNQRLIQAAALASRQNIRSQVQRISIRRVRAGIL